LGSDAIEMTDRQIKIANYEHPVSLELQNHYEDMCD